MLRTETASSFCRIRFRLPCCKDSYNIRRGENKLSQGSRSGLEFKAHTDPPELWNPRANRLSTCVKVQI